MNLCKAQQRGFAQCCLNQRALQPLFLLVANGKSTSRGACGEVAVAKAMGRYWGGSVNTFKSIGDLVSVGWEIRTRAEHSYDLIIRDDDQDDRVFVLVTGKAPNYVVRGWIKAGDAKERNGAKIMVGISQPILCRRVN